jgi:protein-disulfide isomerase
MSELVRPFDPARDHWRGGEGAMILEYGDYECPYSRQAFRNIEHLQAQDPSLRFVFRHFPLTEIHPIGVGALGHIRQDVESGIVSGEVRGTPTLFIDGVVHRGRYDATALLEALAGP